LASDGVEVARGTWHPPRSNAAMRASLLADGTRLSIRLDDGAIACRDDLKTVSAPAQPRQSLDVRDLGQ
jgi:hypothetical protein